MEVVRTTFSILWFPSDTPFFPHLLGFTYTSVLTRINYLNSSILNWINLSSNLWDCLIAGSWRCQLKIYLMFPLTSIKLYDIIYVLTLTSFLNLRVFTWGFATLEICNHLYNSYFFFCSKGLLYSKPLASAQFQRKNHFSNNMHWIPRHWPKCPKIWTL